MIKILQYLLIVSLGVTLFFAYFHPIVAMNQDLGRHLLTGKIILETHTVPNVNLYSYTYPQFPFINHHWFSEVLFYLIEQTIGLSGLLLITTSIALAAFGIIFYSAAKRSSILAAGIVACCSIPILLERTDLRPEVFSFLFLSLYSMVLYEYRKKATKWILVLIPLQIVWTNIHIYFFIGILLVSFFVLDELIRNRRELFQKHHVPYRTRFLLGTWIGMLFATLLNPNGIQGALYPLHVFENYGYTIAENQTAWFIWNYTQKINYAWFFILAAILFTSLLISFRKSMLIDWILACFFTVVGYMALRNFPLFVFGIYIPFTHAIDTLISALMFHKPIIRFGLYCILIGIVLYQLKPIHDMNMVGIKNEGNAKAATDFVQKHHIKGPLFNNFDIGSFLEYRLYPTEKVFVDGRPEAYPASFFQQLYIPMQEDITKFESIDQHYHFNMVFFSYTDQTPWASQFIPQIIRHKDWKLVYLDDFIFIMVKDIPQNKSLIDHLAINPNEPRIETNDPRSLYRLAYFFQQTQNAAYEKEMYYRILAKNNQQLLCAILYNLTELLRKTNDPATTIYERKYQHSCI